MMSIQTVPAADLPAGHDWLLVKEADGAVTLFVDTLLGRPIALDAAADLIEEHRAAWGEVAAAVRHLATASRLATAS